MGLDLSMRCDFDVVAAGGRCDAIAQPTHMRCDAISAHAIGITQPMRCDVDARRHRCCAHKQQEQSDAMSMRSLEAGMGGQGEGAERLAWVWQ